MPNIYRHTYIQYTHALALNGLGNNIFCLLQITVLIEADIHACVHTYSGLASGTGKILQCEAVSHTGATYVVEDLPNKPHVAEVGRDIESSRQG